MSRGRILVALLVLSLAVTLGAVGCASRPGNDVRSNLNVMHQERSSDKLFERGRAFAAVGDYTRAEQYLSLALDADGDVSIILPLLIRVCIEGERYLAALEYARGYLAKNPDDAHLRFVVGSLEAAVGNSKDAVAELRTVTETRPGDAEPHFALASLVRDSRGDLLEADHHFREYLRLSPAGPHAAEARAALLKVVP